MVIDMANIQGCVDCSDDIGRVNSKRKTKAIRRYLKGLSERLMVWQRNSRSRRELLSLNAYQLKDIGLTRADALQEAAKPFWK